LELLAAQHDNVLRADERWLTQQIGSHEQVNLDALDHFLIRVEAPDPSAAGKLLARQLHDADPETELEAERKPEEERSGRHPRYSASFLAFWEVYPDRTKKQAAYYAFNAALEQLGGGPSAFQHVMTALRTQVSNGQFMETDRVLSAANWLRDARWEDGT
jgi:hypothetical protein